jgi:hypothetical protein
MGLRLPFVSNNKSDDNHRLWAVLRKSVTLEIDNKVRKASRAWGNRDEICIADVANALVRKYSIAVLAVEVIEHLLEASVSRFTSRCDVDNDNISWWAISKAAEVFISLLLVNTTSDSKFLLEYICPR